MEEENKVFWEFLQSRAGESEENGSGVDKGEVVVGSRLRKKHEKSAAKYGKIVHEDFYQNKKSSSTNHMIRIIGGVKTKNQTVKGAGFARILRQKIKFYG